jgi:hypothetical protein
MNEHRITGLPARLREYTDQTVPPIRKLYEGAVNGKFPAYQVNKIWHFDESNVPAIAAAYGLAPKAARRPQRKAPAQQVAA